MAQHEINIAADRSVWLDANDEYSRVNNTDYLRVGDYVHLGGYEYLSKYSAAIGFAYESLPERKKILAATVYIHAKTSAALSRRFWYWHKRDNWTESDITYNNFLGITYGSEYGPLSAPYDSYTAGNEYGINVGLIFAREKRSFLLMNRLDNAATCDFYSTRASSGVRPYMKVTYEDVPPDKPTLIGPEGVFKDSTAIIRFEWQYNSSVGGTQKKFELQWSTNQLDWSTISETTENNFYDMPAETLPTGNIYWKVKTYNEYDEDSEYSDAAAFYSIGAPETPGITSVSDECRPLVEWVAFDQQIYQIQILQDETVIHDTSDIPGISTRQYRIPVFLDDGEYLARMRIKNEYDMWSEWGTTSFTISTTKPDKPTLSIQRSQYGLELTIGGSQETSYIYRDGVCIAITEDERFFDNTGASGKEYQYFVRALSEDGFADSDIELGIPSFRYGLLNTGDEVIELKHNINTVPGKNLNNTQSGTLNMYDGRKYPVPEMSSNVEQTLVLGYFFRAYQDVEKLIEIADQKDIVLYRDKRGRKMYGKITGLSVQDTFHGHNVSITISATDYDEAVEV